MQGSLLVCLVTLLVTLADAAPKHADPSQMQEVPRSEHQVEGTLQDHKTKPVPFHEVQIWELNPSVRNTLSTEESVHANGAAGGLLLFGKFITSSTTDAMGGFSFDVPTADQYVVTAMIEGRRSQGIIASTTTEMRTRRGVHRRSYNVVYSPPPLICRQWVVRTVWDATATCTWVPFLWTPYNNNYVTRLMHPAGEPMLCQNGVPGNPTTCDFSYWRYTHGTYGVGTSSLCEEPNNAEAYAIWNIYENQNGRDFNFGIYARNGDIYSRRNEEAAAIYVWRSGGNSVPLLESLIKLNASLSYVENTNGQFWNAARVRITTPAQCFDWTNTTADLDAGAGQVFYKTNIRCGPYNSTGSDDRLPLEGTSSQNPRKCGVNV